MSMEGQRHLELERRRREELRLEQVRRESQALLSVCNATLAGILDPAVQQYAAAELREVVQAIREAEPRIQTEPDASLGQLQALQQRLASVVTAAQARAQAWTESRTRLQSQLETVTGRIEALAASQKDQATSTLEAARQCVEQARGLVTRGAETDARSCLEKAEQTLEMARSKALEERVRKEVVKGLLKTLKEMGFVIKGPQLSAQLVILEGRLPSGRQARFEVRLDGQLNFDLDGYEGRSCAQDLEKVETAMRDRFGVTMGPPQVVWKNPDRLSQGALELPGSGRSRGGR
jgi:hypothetical protein